MYLSDTTTSAREGRRKEVTGAVRQCAGADLCARVAQGLTLDVARQVAVDVEAGLVQERLQLVAAVVARELRLR